jgi:hypothetical protein
VAYYGGPLDLLLDRGMVLTGSLHREGLFGWSIGD